MLDPMFEMEAEIWREAPLPISIIVITAAMPMIMPNMVNNVRVTLRPKAINAV